MITFEEFDEAITNVAIDAVFPKKDLYKKSVYKDEKIGMSYFIMPFGYKNYRIGFIQEQDSFQFTVWNGKMDHIVFDVDERDGCIRYYHEPELYDRDNGLSHSQIQTIGETLIKYLTSNKEAKDNNELEETKHRDDIMITSAVLLEEKDTKKHPLQNSPTFPEEESVEEKQCAIMDDELAVATEDKTWMKSGGKFDKPIDPFKMVPIFDVDKFEEGYPYVLKNLENGKMGIVTLHCKSADSLCFNYWDDDGEDAVIDYSVSEFQGTFELYKINEL